MRGGRGARREKAWVEEKSNRRKGTNKKKKLRDYDKQ